MDLRLITEWDKLDPIPPNQARFSDIMNELSNIVDRLNEIEKNRLFHWNKLKSPAREKLCKEIASIEPLVESTTKINSIDGNLDEYINTVSASKFLNMHTEKVLGYARKKYLKSFKINRQCTLFKISDLEYFVNNHKKICKLNDKRYKTPAAPLILL